MLRPVIPAGQRGLTLIELVVAMVIAGVAIAGLGMVFVAGTGAWGDEREAWQVRSCAEVITAAAEDNGWAPFGDAAEESGLICEQGRLEREQLGSEYQDAFSAACGEPGPELALVGDHPEEGVDMCRVTIGGAEGITLRFFFQEGS